MKTGWIIFCALLFLLPESYAAELKILTWNVYMLPKPIKFSRQRERTPLIIEQLKKLDHDLVVLEEAFTCPFINKVKAQLQSKWPYQKTLGKSGSWRQVMNSGVTVLSKYPFKVDGQDFYRECAIADCYASKGFMLLTVNHPSGPVQVAATHMQAGGEARMERIRTSQLEQIKVMLDQKKVSGVPQILVGDLNINALQGEEFPNALKQMEMESSLPTGELRSSKSQLTDCMGKKNSRKASWLDHMLVRANGSSIKTKEKNIFLIQDWVKGEWCDLSDHRPVEESFTL